MSESRSERTHHCFQSTDRSNATTKSSMSGIKVTLQRVATNQWMVSTGQTIDCSIRGYPNPDRMRTIIGLYLEEDNYANHLRRSAFNGQITLRFTRLIIDKLDFKLRQLVNEFRESLSPEKSFYLYREFRRHLKTKEKILKANVAILRSRHRFLRRKWKRFMKKSRKGIKKYKEKQWCRLCGCPAAKHLQCCAKAEYCSFSHYKADKNHFLNCHRQTN